MKVSVVCIKTADMCGLDRYTFYKYGIELFMFVYIDNNLNSIKSALKSVFEESDGICVLYSKKSWPNLQKSMLMEFERSSVFVEGKIPYVIANGFKEIGKGIYFDNVYNKPFMFISSDLKEDFSFGNMLSIFSSNKHRIGVFGTAIESSYTLFSDEVETVMAVDDLRLNDALNLIEDKTKIYTTNGESPQAALLKTLKKKNSTIAAAESCTAGMIASSIADIPGASEYLKGGCITYSNDLKSRFLGVNTNTLETYGAVSKEVAVQMAVGILNNTSSDFSVAVTGIAGPGGGTKQKPIGLVYIAAASRFGVDVREVIFGGNRKLIREKTAKFAILFLRDFILRQ